MININEKKEYDVRQLSVVSVIENPLKRGMRAVIEFVEITPYDPKEVIDLNEYYLDKYSIRFPVDYEIHDNHIIIKSDIPKRFSEKDIKYVLSRGFIERRYK